MSVIWHGRVLRRWYREHIQETNKDGCVVKKNEKIKRRKKNVRIRIKWIQIVLYYGMYMWRKIANATKTGYVYKMN